MKLPSVPALLAAALFSLVVVVPFLPAAKDQPDFFRIEARLSSDVRGRMQVFFDDGQGFREAASATTAVEATSDAAVYHVPLPPGTYRALRLDPLDRAGTLRLVSLRVVSHSGRVLRDIDAAAIKPVHQIEAVRPSAGGLEIVTARNANDPQLAITFARPLEVNAGWREYVAGLAPRALGVFALVYLGLVFLPRATRMRAAFAQTSDRLAARPARAVALVAALAVVASTYPVVFLGKSHVSPNLGTVLLYDEFPTLPGYDSSETTDVKLADIGAVMWAHLPYSTVQRRALAQGELPLWNRYNAAGVPLLAQGQSMFGDPLHFLVIGANGAAWAWDVKYVVAKWLFASALGLMVLSLTGGRQRFSTASDSDVPAALRPAGHAAHLLPALMVAAAAPFIGFFVYRLNHPAFFSLCYAPWALYCWLRISKAETARSLTGWLLGLIVANLALMNSGTVKEAYMLLVLMNVGGATVLLTSEAPWRRRLVKLAAAGWAGVLFVLLTMPIWATFLQTLRSAYTGYNVMSAYQVQPTLLLGAFDEAFYRPLMEHARVFNPSLNFLLLLGLLYFLATLRTSFRERGVMALAVVSLVPLSLAFGLVPPTWIQRLPFLGNVAHLDNTFTCVLIVFWSVLAGVGFTRAFQRLGTAEGRGDLWIVALLLFALVFGWIAFRQAAHRPIAGPTFSVHAPGQVLPIPPFLWGYLAVLLLATAGFATTLRRSVRFGGLTPARTLLLATAALVLLWRHGLHASTVGFETYTARPTARVDFHAKSEAISLARQLHAREPGRGFGLHGNLFPGWAGTYGVETVHGPDALVNPWLRDLVGVSGVQRIWDWRHYVEPAAVAHARPFFDALNVRFYFDLRSDQGLLGQSLRLVKTADLDVYESPTAWPRAFFTDRLVVYDEPAELIARLRSADARPFAAMQRSDLAVAPEPYPQTLAVLPREQAGRAVVPATDYRFTENTTSFQVSAPSRGAIVLTETFWPGDFRVEVNGRKLPVVRLNHAFKGVLVDGPGEYRVTFRYVPKNFPRTLALSGTGAALLACSLGLVWWRTRLRASTRPSVSPLARREAEATKSTA